MKVQEFIILDNYFYRIDNLESEDIENTFTYGILYGDIAIVEYLNKVKDIDIILKAGAKKVYIVNEASGLVKQADPLQDCFVGVDGPETNFTAYQMFYTPKGFLVQDLQDKIVNNDIIKEQYGPTISREWVFEKSLDNPEWLMRDIANKL